MAQSNVMRARARQRAAAMGGGNRENQKKLVTDFYVYTAYQASLANGVAQNLTVNIEADSNFELQKVTYYCDLNTGMEAATRVIPQLSLQITDQGSSRNLFASAIPLSMIAGEGDLPFIMPVTKWFKKNSLVTLSIANFSSATTYYNIYIALIGKKVWGA